VIVLRENVIVQKEEEELIVPLQNVFKNVLTVSVEVVPVSVILNMMVLLVKIRFVLINAVDMDNVVKIKNVFVNSDFLEMIVLINSVRIIVTKEVLVKKESAIVK